jgi:hypothetical protein
MLDKYTHTYTVEEVYGKPLSEIQIPEGYQVVDFRFPNRGDYYLLYGGAIGTPDTETYYGYCRLILEKVKRKRIIFETTGEIRQARAGELIYDPNTSTIGKFYQESTNNKYNIVKFIREEDTPYA